MAYAPVSADEIRAALELDAVEFSAAIVDIVRPLPTPKIRQFVEILREDDDLREAIVQKVRGRLGEVRLVHSLAESGILTDRGFFLSMQSNIASTFLPLPAPDDDLRTLIRQVFQPNDWRWLRKVPSNTWRALFKLFVVPADTDGIPHEDVGAAILGLSQRAGALGIDEEINARLHEVEDYSSPFLDLTPKARDFLQHHEHMSRDAVSFEALIDTIQECRSLVRRLRSNKQEYGTSLRLTALTRRLSQQLRRLEILAHMVHPHDVDDFVRSLVPVFIHAVEAELRNRSLKRSLIEHVDLLAFQVTEQTAKKGHKYITETVAGYWKFLLRAMGGGVLVAIFAIIKPFISQLDVSLAATAFLYSVNYAICFVLIFLSGSILATKQPAVTASAIARRMDDAKTEEGAIEGVADMIVLVWRSQFISFVGNVVAAIPVAVLITLLLAQGPGIEVANASKAQSLLADMHPFKSGSLFFAGIAGVFLFLSGVITGWIDNYVTYIDLPTRLKSLGIIRIFGSRSDGIARAISSNLGGISGNVVFGFFLGSASIMGVILGLPIDIRHIAFSSAYLGVAAFSDPSGMTPGVIAISALGVAMIGMMNFIVSFGLTLVITLESRGVSFGAWYQLHRTLRDKFFARPLEWFWPVSKQAATES